MPAQTPKQGYTENDAALKVLDTEVSIVGLEPLVGRLEITTDQGRMCVLLSGNAAEDLLIDLKQFLAHDL